MNRRNATRGWPVSPALVVSVIALVAAVAGTAVAQQANTSAKAVSKKKAKSIANKEIDKRLPLGTDDIADGAVTEGKLAGNAVTSGKIAGGAVTTNKLPNAAVSSAKLAAGSVRAGKLGAITQRTNEEVIPNDDGATVSVDCNPGERLISGGVDGPVPTADGWVIYESRPLANGWQGRARNTSGGQEGFKVYALCLQGG